VKKTKSLTYLLIGCFFVICNCYAETKITSRESPLLTLSDVLKAPEKYNNKRIIINCIYFETFEYTVFGSDIIVHDTGYYLLENGDVWAFWRMDRPKEALNETLKKMPKSKFPTLYGNVQVDGIFRQMNGVGHLGEYKYAFYVQGIRISDKSYGDFRDE